MKSKEFINEDKKKTAPKFKKSNDPLLRKQVSSYNEDKKEIDLINYIWAQSNFYNKHF